MKKKAAIITIIITSAIIWMLTALAVCIRSSQTRTFTQPIHEAGSGITQMKNSIKQPVSILPVGKVCEFTITVDGPEEIVPVISISLGSAKADPIYITTATNRTISTGRLNVDNKEIFINFNYENMPEFDENKDYSIRYTIEMNSGNYSLFNSIMIAIAALCIIPLGISISCLTEMSENNEKAYDERQMKMRGKAAMSTLIVVMITALGLGFMSVIYNGFPLKVYECMMIVAFVGIAAFAITADRNDAYMGLKGKRRFFAAAFTIIGIIDLALFVIDLIMSFTGIMPENKIDSLVQGICCLAVGSEMITKSIKDKKEAAADEES